MPKKTAYSRSGAQRNKAKQKSFELVRSVSDDNELETSGESEEVEVEEEEGIVSTAGGEGVIEEEEVQEVRGRAGKSVGVKENAPATVAALSTVSEAATSAPKSASARLAARRQAVQKTQRSSASLITTDHYSYVRKELIFILILAVIMFSTIIALHFVLGG